MGQATIERLAEAASGLGRGEADRFSAGGAGGAVGGPGRAEQLGFDLAGDAGDAGPLAEAAARRAVLIAGLEPALPTPSARRGATELYGEVEQPLVRVLAKMEVAGIAVDVERLRGDQRAR